MNVALWMIAALTAAAFLGAGFLKVTTEKSLLIAKGFAWAEDFSPNVVRAIGAAEVLGAVGLVLPQALGVAQPLTPIAALCLAALMIGATVVHYRRQETKDATPSIVLAILCLVVAVGRF